MVNGKLVKEFERRVFETPADGKAFLDEWMSSPGVNVSRTVYHGSASFVGNMAHKFIKKVNSLESKVKESLSTEKIKVAESYIKAFKELGKVIVSCFGQELVPGYGGDIDQFMTTYRSLQISIPLKVHLLETHAMEFLIGKGEKHGLGYYSEQAMESMHKELKSEWGSEKVDVKHPNFGDNLKKTIVRINGKHL